MFGMSAIFIIILLALVIAIGYGLVIVVRTLIKKADDSTETNMSVLQLPPRFTPALLVLLLGFQLGLYSFMTFAGPTLRLPAGGLLVFSLATTIMWALLQTKRTLFIYSLLALNVLTGASLFLRANGFIQTWSAIIFWLVQVILLITLLRPSVPVAIGTWLTSAGKLLPLAATQFLLVFRSAFRRDTTAKSAFFGWIKTLIFAFIVVVVFLGLLSQADPVFAELVSEFRSQIVGRTLWSIVLVVLTATLWTIRMPTENDNETQAGWLSHRDSTVIQSLVILIVGSFLVVQFQYLFAGSTELLIKLDLTFSEYVRQGFSELLLAILIGGIIVFLAGVRTRTLRGMQKITTQVLLSVLLLELGLLLFSALQRNMLYVDAYGLTRVRVMGDFFLAWLGLFLGILLAFGWQKLSEKRALAGLWIGALAVIVCINVINIDKVVVAGAPSHHQFTDYFYLMQLSEDAAPKWPELLDRIEEDTTPLLVKSELTDIEKSQLASLKLAVISFIENRDRLYLEYAPDDWLKQNYMAIGLRFDDSGNNPDYSSGYSQLSVIDSLFPSATAAAPTPAPEFLPKKLKSIRGWQYANLAQLRAYEVLKQNEDTFGQPERILEQILRFQLRNQISLQEEEQRLLFWLRYQFVTVALNRYIPQGYFNLLIRNQLEHLPTFMEQEVQLLEASNDTSVRELAQSRCIPGSVTPVTLYATLTRQSAVAVASPSAEFKLSDGIAESDSDAMRVQIPKTLLVSAPSNANGETIATPTNEQASNSWHPLFARVSVIPPATLTVASNCGSTGMTATDLQFFATPQ